MTTHPVIMVGFAWTSVAAIGAFQPDASVIVIEEPDVVRKRGLRSAVRGAEVIGDLVECEYQLAGAADAFHRAHPGLAPAAIAPTVEDATLFAARLAECYGLPGAGLGAAQVLHDKSLLRGVTRAAGIPNPESQAVQSPAQVEAFMAAHPGPAVLKPADRQGAVGTRVLRSADQAVEAWAECAAECSALSGSVWVPDRAVPVRMLVERYVSGREYSVEMLVSAGSALFGNVTEKDLYPGPRPVERGHLVPADIPAELDTLLREQTERVVRAVGFGTGMVHCEWIVEAGTPYLVECAGRPPGDEIAELIEWAYDTELVRAFWTLLRGEPLARPLPRRARRAAAIRFLGAPAGVVASLDGLAAAYAVPGVMACGFLVEPGARTREPHHSLDRVGYSISCAATPGEAVRRAEEAIGRLRIGMRPSHASGS
ncbi:ATP-grasp domain-containing protein [Streptomyces sp. NBC_01341]|uniref:ATP-grasp domain-containing protein n=1 Tax=Streptomyces sp. NBC_01341 TaxID=2903831 RepID=UPI002E137D52|nr:ATP-grasp domain-containing protein [Streptomyces sp. NBC_01341]